MPPGNMRTAKAQVRLRIRKIILKERNEIVDNIVNIYHLSQRTTKPTTRLVLPAKTQPSLIRVFADRMCLLQHLGYPK